MKISCGNGTEPIEVEPIAVFDFNIIVIPNTTLGLFPSIMCVHEKPRIIFSGYNYDDRSIYCLFKNKM